MRIAFISDGDPKNSNLWSGTIKHMYEMLCKVHNVIIIDVSKKSKMIQKINRVVTKLTKVICKKKYSGIYSVLNSIYESRMTRKELKKFSNIDCIFCPSKSSSIAFLDTDIPIIYLCDATFGQLVDYYDYLSNLSNINRYEGEIIEKQAIKKSTYIICASDWTKESVVNKYNKDEKTIFVIPFGANMNFEAKKRNLDSPINILFCGVDWERKGGNTALDTVKELKRRNYDVELNLVGCKSPHEIKENYIHVIGFLDKNNNEEKMILKRIYEKTHFLLLPTNAECAGIVFAESSALGIPSITYDTGGVGSYVINNVNGVKLNRNSSYIEFANVIEEYLKDKNKYSILSETAVNLYKEKLNWDVWLELTNRVFNKIN